MLGIFGVLQQHSVQKDFCLGFVLQVMVSCCSCLHLLCLCTQRRSLERELLHVCITDGGQSLRSQPQQDVIQLSEWQRKRWEVKQNPFPCLFCLNMIKHISPQIILLKSPGMNEIRRQFMSKDNEIGTPIRYWGIWVFSLCNIYGDKFWRLYSVLSWNYESYKLLLWKGSKAKPTKTSIQGCPFMPDVHRSKKIGG